LVGRYISVERLIEESNGRLLRGSPDQFHGLALGEARCLLWLNYFLVIIRRAYLQFEERAGQVKSPRGAKMALIEASVSGFAGEFGLSDIERICPGVSRDMVRHVLQDMQNGGKIQCLGKGRTAKWRKRVITRK